MTEREIIEIERSLEQELWIDSKDGLKLNLTIDDKAIIKGTGGRPVGWLNDKIIDAKSSCNCLKHFSRNSSSYFTLTCGKESNYQNQLLYGTTCSRKPNVLTRQPYMPLYFSKLNSNTSKLFSTSNFFYNNEKGERDTVNSDSVSTDKTKRNESVATNDVNASPPEEQSPSLFKRFKDAYKEYGKVLVGVHVATSIVWYGCFFYAAASGIDIVPLLEYIGASERIIKPFVQSGAGNFAVAYLMYKIATPARYTVTLGGTQMTVKQLRKYGYMEQPSPEDSIRNLMKQGQSQVKDRIDDLKDKVDDVRDEVKDRFGEIKDKVDERRDEMKDNMKGRIDKFKDKRQKKS